MKVQFNTFMSLLRLCSPYVFYISEKYGTLRHDILWSHSFDTILCCWHAPKSIPWKTLHHAASFLPNAYGQLAERLHFAYGQLAERLHLSEMLMT